MGERNIGLDGEALRDALGMDVGGPVYESVARIEPSEAKVSERGVDAMVESTEVMVWDAIQEIRTIEGLPEQPLADVPGMVDRLQGVLDELKTAREGRKLERDRKLRETELASMAEARIEAQRIRASVDALAVVRGRHIKKMSKALDALDVAMNDTISSLEPDAGH